MLSESDLNLLEAYLDDALSASDVQALDARLSEDPQTAAALDSLRRQRQARVAAFASLTPEPAEADRFASGVLVSVRRRQFNRNMLRGARWIGSLAACLIVGFFVGWMGRGTPNQIAMPSTSPDGKHVVIPISDPGQYQVAVVDGNGKVISVQHFSKLENASEFASYIKQYPARRQQALESSSAVGPTPPLRQGLDAKTLPPHHTPSTTQATQPSK